MPPTAPALGGAGFWAVLSRIFKVSREIALTLVAVLGLVCILALVLGFVYKASFVVFRTGSMEPHYPVGALSLTVQVQAAELAPGDVVSVKRAESGVLVTHRVVSVEPSGTGASLRLKGDANSSEDPLPYQVETAQKVLVTVPAVGSWVMAMRGPGFIGAATMAVAGLVVWAYWPKRVARHKGVVSTGR
ncbi:signal peptidase I [Paenarthrobacter nicotinovorans]|uniref:signal peptidase I n=1 Tax=Paenarthrobacter nicotinovorans TaxID=29320 RepID=UPI0021B1C571|nr:signal peptidase I [Paenarthrobacter nicotinovorans]